MTCIAFPLLVGMQEVLSRRTNGLVFTSLMIGQKVSDCCYFTHFRDVGKLCIEVDPSKKIAYISEELCIGCGICPKKCVLPVLRRQVVLETDGFFFCLPQDVLSKLSTSSTFLPTLNPKSLIVTEPTRSNCIGYRHRDLVKSWDWSEPTVLERVQHSRFCLEN